MIDETKIMQYADGTLPIEEHDEVKKAIESDPKLKELYNNFQETGDLIFKLGTEIKSQPLPKKLQEKAEILKTWKKPAITEVGFFNFFGLFKVQYAGVAAAFCLFFVGGFYTNTFVASIDDSDKQIVRLSNEVNIDPEKLKMRSLQSKDEDLQTRIVNLYKYFDEDSFLQEISNKVDDLQINDQIDTNIEDNIGKKVSFTLVDNFKVDGKNCKKLVFSEPVKLSNIDEGTTVTLDLCKIDENYELTSINFQK
jgi:hypothetical protein